MENFQTPFSGDLDCELSVCRNQDPVCYPLSIPVFRGSRLWGSWAWFKQSLWVFDFQSPFSGDLDCETTLGHAGVTGWLNFQSPFSGDLDCEEIEHYRTSWLARYTFNPRFQGISIVRPSVLKYYDLLPRCGFQSPFSGDLDCEDLQNFRNSSWRRFLSIPVFRGSRLWAMGRKPHGHILYD